MHPARSAAAVARRTARLPLVLLAGLAAAATVAVPAPAATVTGPDYGQYQPYASAAHSIAPAPAGSVPVYLESVGRHGSRSSTSSSSADAAIKVWKTAKKKKALTKIGTSFGGDATRLRTAMADLGWGELSPLGAKEWQAIGRQTVADYPQFFTAAAATRAPVRIVTSSSSRAQASSDNFRAGITAAQPGLTTTARKTDDTLLRFPTGTSRAGKAATAKIETSSATRAAARDTLTYLYGAKYTKSIDDEVGAAHDIWAVYSAAPAMGMDLSRYIKPVDAAQLGYANDAKAFYRYGPSAAGTDQFKSAAPLRDDFLRAIDAHLNGSDPAAATFRFGHGETVMPLASLFRIPGYDKQATAATPFTYRSTGWRGDVQAKMAVNLDWAVYRHNDQVLVTMRFNQQPTRFGAACTPVAPGSYFYDLNTLRACLPRS